MKKNVTRTAVLTFLAFMLFVPSTFANTRLEDARKIQSEMVSGNFSSERLAAAEKIANERRFPKKSNGSSPVKNSVVVINKETTDGFITPTFGRFTSKFGWRDIGAGQEFHKGIDIANFIGTDVVAAAGGVVTFSGVMGGYGNVVMLQHNIKGQVYATVYAHLSSLNVSSGQNVMQGQSIGKMGNTGRSFGSHLHFEIHIGEWNGGRTNAVDPTRFINI